MNYLFKYNKYDLPLVFKGRGFSLDIEMTDNDDEPIDITSYTISSKVRTEYSQSSDFICSFDIVKTSATLGKFTLGLTATVTASISQTYGYYDIKVEDGVNPEPETYVSVLSLLPDAGRERGDHQDDIRLPEHGETQRNCAIPMESAQKPDVLGISGGR
jgi:hypothetical protein